MKKHRDDDEVDVVVVGTGAGASPLLAELADASVSVVALEAGRFWPDPSAFPADELAARDIYWTEDRFVTGDPVPIFGGNNGGIGVGGSTLHYGAFVPRVDRRDLKLASETGMGVDWPIDYAELVPFYEAVEAFLAVSGPSPYPWDPSRRYPCAPIPINAPGHLMQRAFADGPFRTAPAPIAATSRRTAHERWGERPACIACGFCHQGCPNGSKASMDVTYLPWAVARGAEIRPACRAIGFERDASGRLTAVVYRDAEGRTRRQKCRTVVLAAGAVETPRLLLHADLANGSGQVGRNFTAHVATQVWGTFDEPVHMHHGFPATVITEDFVRPADADFAGGYLLQSLGVVPVTWASNLVRARRVVGDALTRELARYDHAAGIGMNGECLPSANNVLTLAEEKDDFGIPRAAVHFEYGANERAMHAHADAVMRGAWERVDAKDIWSMHRVAHTIGTCRMSRTPEEGVVDPFGRSHEIENLWICDASVFPSSLAANPALTIMSLSLRTAARMLEASKS